MIIIKEISKSFTDVKALDGVSLTVESGSIMGLIGSNGSGKSTLLRAMCGIYKPDEGEILYDGAPVFENYILKQRIVYLSDEQYFAPAATLDDMRELYQSVYDTFDTERYTKMTDMFGLDRSRKISTFSKGMQKQSSLLLGMSVRPDFLLCDETFDGIDPVMRQLVRRMIAEDVADRGLTAIISTHNLRELEDICDHICLLHKGKLVLDRDLDNMKISIHKVQFAVENQNIDLSSLDIISHDVRGRLHSVICRGDADAVDSAVKALSPIYYDMIPLTLEEIFISEMEDIGYDSNKVIF